MRIWLSVIVLITPSLCLGWADTWEGIRTAAEQTHAIQADFVQEKHLPILAKPLVSTGRLFYRRPDALRWEYETPVRSVLIIQGGKARRFVETDQGLVEEDGVRMQAMQFVIPEIGGWFEGRFQNNSLFEASLAGANTIRLVPKDEGLTNFIKRIELTMADRPGVIEQVLIYESEEAFTRMVFSNTQINPVLAPRLFQDVQ
jgi:outer membrane lipoprotein-sorting protein